MAKNVHHIEEFTSNGRMYFMELKNGTLTLKANYAYDDKENTEVSFEVGDEAEHGSYNLIYTGKIVSITPKTVTVERKDIGCGNRRLKWNEFAWRNHDFDAAKVASYNSNEMMYI